MVTELAVDMHGSGVWLFRRAVASCFGVVFPLTPDPSPPMGARGGFCVFGCSVNRTGTPRPWKGRGVGGEG